jgi:hypothetical protein
MSRKNGHLFFRKPVETKNMLLFASPYFVTISGIVIGIESCYFLTIMNNGNKMETKIQYMVLY